MQQLLKRRSLLKRGWLVSLLLAAAISGCAATAPSATLEMMLQRTNADDISSVNKMAMDDQPLRAFAMLEGILQKQPFLSGYAAQISAFLGRDNATRALFDSQRKPYTADKSVLVAELSARNAIEEIVAASKNYRVVIINEGHASQRERVFSHLLAKALKPAGFTHLGFEALNSGGETGIPQDGPTRDTTFYTIDPVFSDYIRQTKKIGYEVFGYEPDHEEQSKGDQKQQFYAREFGQAQNIKRVLDANPNAKILIHCGGGHGSKALYRGEILMGGHLMAMMSADVLSIQQGGGIPNSAPVFDLPVYQSVAPLMLPSKPTVFRKSDGKWLASPGFDMVVFHPRVPDIYDRGGWMTMDGYRKLHLVDIPAQPARTLVRARVWPLQARGIAMDQVVAYAGDTQAPLFLPVGEYQLSRDSETGEKTILGRVKIK